MSAASPLLDRPDEIVVSPEAGAFGWVATVDHKRIGIFYLLTALFFFVIGGLEALVIRVQLARPLSHVVSAETFAQLFTMHGTTMIFLVVMPTLIGFANYLVPLMIGAGDMAFPRMTRSATGSSPSAACSSTTACSPAAPLRPGGSATRR